jgi:hypothetical protein
MYARILLTGRRMCIIKYINGYGVDPIGKIKTGTGEDANPKKFVCEKHDLLKYYQIAFE